MYYVHILLGIYALILLGIFAFYAILYLHIKKFVGYSSYLMPIYRLILAVSIIIAILGGYMIWNGNNTVFYDTSFDYNQHDRADY